MEQIGIFIVDDEIASIEYFKSILGTECERYQVVGEAQNAKKALQQIAAQKPDIIFIDVCMPGMDGLELSKQVLKILPLSKIILLTAYKNFEYIRQGYAIGIAGYLVKHELDHDVLCREIDRHFEQMQIDQVKNMLHSQYSLQQVIESETDVMPDFLKGLLKNKDLFLVGIVENKGFSLYSDEMRTENLKMKYQLEEVEKICLDCDVVCEAVLTDQSPVWIALLSTFHVVSRQERYYRLYAVTSRLCTVFQSKNTLLHGFFSNPVENSSELRDNYYRILAVSKKVFFLQGRKVNFLNEVSNVREVETDYESVLDNFCVAFQRMDEQSVSEYKDKLLEYAEAKGDLVTYSNVVRDILLCINQICQRHFSFEPGLFLESRPGLYSSEEAEKWLSEEIKECMEKIRLGRNANYSVYTRKAIEFIRKNFAQNISVEDVAQAVHLSNGHLRRMFKKETGTTLADYLVDYRIKMAKQYLDEGTDRISELYEKTGFASSQYFGRVFKKKTGMTPKNYYNQTGKKSNYDE